MPRFWRRALGPRVITRPQVKSGATSPGQQVWIGRRVRSTSLPSQTISWQAGLLTFFGLMSHSADFSIDTLASASRRPLGASPAQRGQQFADVAQRADVVGAHAARHPRGRAEQVGQHRHPGRLAVVQGLFEQQGRALGAQHAVGNLGHFQARRDRRGDAFELAHAFKLGEEVSKVAVFHYRSRLFGYILGRKRG